VLSYLTQLYITTPICNINIDCPNLTLLTIVNPNKLVPEYFSAPKLEEIEIGDSHGGYSMIALMLKQAPNMRSVLLNNVGGPHHLFPWKRIEELNLYCMTTFINWNDYISLRIVVIER
jgi:hypothetical protein